MLTAIPRNKPANLQENEEGGAAVRFLLQPLQSLADEDRSPLLPPPHQILLRCKDEARKFL